MYNNDQITDHIYKISQLLIDMIAISSSLLKLGDHTTLG